MKCEKIQGGTVKKTRGCLLVHGYGGSSFEMEPLELALAHAGFVVRNTTLPGHGEGFADFATQRFSDWVEHVDREFTELAATCAETSVVGFSLGGTLALNIAARYPVSRLVCLATPMHVLALWPWPLVHLALCARSAAKLICKRMGRPVPDKSASRAIAPWKGYSGPLHIPQLASFRAGCRATRSMLPRVTAPLLLMHDKRDRLVRVGDTWHIARHVQSPSVTIRLTSMRENVTKHHMLTTHEETRDFVAAEVVAFLADNQ